MFGMPVIAVASLEDVIAFLGGNTDMTGHLGSIEAYKQAYGAA